MNQGAGEKMISFPGHSDWLEGMLHPKKKNNERNTDSGKKK